MPLFLTILFLAFTSTVEAHIAFPHGPEHSHRGEFGFIIVVILSSLLVQYVTRNNRAFLRYVGIGVTLAAILFAVSLI